jgi:hypothetical protein
MAFLLLVYPIYLAESARASYLPSQSAQSQLQTYSGTLKEFLRQSPLGSSQGQLQSSLPYRDSTTSQEISTLRTTLQELQEKLSIAKSNLVTTQSSLSEAESQYETTKTTLNQADASLTDQTQILQTSEGSLNVALAKLNNAASDLASAESSYASAYAAYTSATDKLSSAQSALSVAEYNYNESNITTPNPEASSGLTVEVYTGVDSLGNPPVRSTSAYNLCKTTRTQAINNDWGGGDIYGCGSDFIMLHYTGYITMSADIQAMFYAYADDGFYLSIGGNTIINDWYLKGCLGGNTGSFSFSANTSYYIDAWMYEWGGSACNSLNYIPSGVEQSWTPVPSHLFTTQPAYIQGKDPELYQLVLNAQAAVASAISGVRSAASKLGTKQAELDSAQSSYNQYLEGYNDASKVYQSAQAKYNTLLEAKATAEAEYTTSVENVNTKTSLVFEAEAQVTTISADISTTEVRIAYLESLPEPPAPEKEVVIEPSPSPAPAPKPEPEPTPEVDIAKQQAYEVLDTAKEGSPEYQAALDQLFLIAQEDDIQVPEEIASIPVLGVAVQGITDAINFLGNAGSDMSPKAREESKKIVVAAIVASQVAQVAVSAAAASASSAAVRRTQ